MDVLNQIRRNIQKVAPILFRKSYLSILMACYYAEKYELSRVNAIIAYNRAHGYFPPDDDADSTGKEKAVFTERPEDNVLPPDAGLRYDILEEFLDKRPITADPFYRTFRQKEDVNYEDFKKYDKFARQKAFAMIKDFDGQCLKQTQSKIAKLYAAGMNENSKEFQAILKDEITTFGNSYMKLVYRNNVNSAAQATRKQVAEKYKSEIWGYEYKTQDDGQVRESHAALNGTRLPIDHPFWTTNYPPNGHNCRCFTIEIPWALAQVEGLTYTPEDEIPKEGGAEDDWGDPLPWTAEQSELARDRYRGLEDDRKKLGTFKPLEFIFPEQMKAPSVAKKVVSKWDYIPILDAKLVEINGRTFVQDFQKTEPGYKQISAKVLSESEKAIKVEIHATTKAGDPTLITTWIPKSVAEPHSHGVQVKKWFVDKLKEQYRWAVI